MRSALIKWFPSNKPTRMEKKISLIGIFTVVYGKALHSALTETGDYQYIIYSTA